MNRRPFASVKRFLRSATDSTLTISSGQMGGTAAEIFLCPATAKGREIDAEFGKSCCPHRLLPSLGGILSIAPCDVRAYHLDIRRLESELAKERCIGFQRWQTESSGESPDRSFGRMPANSDMGWNGDRQVHAGPGFVAPAERTGRLLPDSRARSG